MVLCALQADLLYSTRGKSFVVFFFVCFLGGFFLPVFFRGGTSEISHQKGFVSPVSSLLMAALWFWSPHVLWLISGSPAPELLLLRNSTQLDLKYILWKGAAFLCEINMLLDWQPGKQAEGCIVSFSAPQYQPCALVKAFETVKHPFSCWHCAKPAQQCMAQIKFCLYCKRCLFPLS